MLQDIVSLRACVGEDGEHRHGWGDIASYVGVKKSQARTKYVNWQRYKTNGVKPGPCPICGEEVVVEGVTADLRCKDAASVWDRAFQLQEEKALYEQHRHEQRIVIPGTEAFAWAFLSDLHFGDGADYRQMKRDAEIIRDTERMYASFNGDGLNNWIVSKLAHLQRGQQLATDDEWILLLDLLAILGDALKVICLGNHDLWTWVLANVDVIRGDVVSRGIKVLYDHYEITYDLILGENAWRIKQRHSWPGKSLFNPTHGIETSWERGGCEFDIGVGSHTHYGTICRPFFRHQRKRFAVQTGTYSLWNTLGRKMGSHPSMNRGCGALVFQAGKEPEFFNDLDTAAQFLRFLNGR